MILLSRKLEKLNLKKNPYMIILTRLSILIGWIRPAIDGQDYFLDLIEAFAKREAMKEAIKKSLILIKEDRMEETEQLVRKALTVSRTVDVGQEYFDDLSSRWNRTHNSEAQDKYKTLLPSLNKSLEGGLGEKELAMVIAPPGVGKSLWLVNQAVQSMMEGRKVLYVSLEMSEDKIAQRFDSITTLIPQAHLKDPSAQLKVEERLSIFQTNFPDSQLMIKEFPCGDCYREQLESVAGAT